MANVERELNDLITQYRAEPTKNINPFSMRLQGIIDANVMGGISKYQEAFLSDEFAQSAEGRGQQSHVHRLRCLIMDQVRAILNLNSTFFYIILPCFPCRCGNGQVGVLETALELHGQLAPGDVQPLHKRLVERFVQLRETFGAAASAVKLAAGRRPHSDSIVNTPLPPLPTDQPQHHNAQQLRSVSMDHQTKHNQYHYHLHSHSQSSDGAYELETGDNLNNHHPTIAKPASSARDGLPHLDFQQYPARQGGDRSDDIYAAPPIPCRPRSACYAAVNSASNGMTTGESPASHEVAQHNHNPDIPPKGTKAPPLPPRGYMPDKRASNPIAFVGTPDDCYSLATDAPHLPRRQPKMSVVNISLDDDVNNGSRGAAEHSMAQSSPPPAMFGNTIDRIDDDDVEADYHLHNRNLHNLLQSGAGVGGTADGQMNNLGHQLQQQHPQHYHHPSRMISASEATVSSSAMRIQMLSNGSGSSNLSSLNISLPDDTLLQQQPQHGSDGDNAPPIPPKSTGCISAVLHAVAAAVEDCVLDGVVEGYIDLEDGYCVPKELQPENTAHQMD